VERVEIDGVTVLWADGPPPLHASLVFGCGHRDEDLDALGITDVVRALATGRLAAGGYDHTAVTDLAATRFTASGTAEQVVAYLGAACTALRNLPLDRLPEVARRLHPAERRPDRGQDAVDVLLSRRFGPHGLGLARWPGTSYEQFTAEEVRRHARRYFVAGNAVLLLTGRPPGALRLPLPPGPLVGHLTPPPVTPDGPRWYAERVSSPGVTLHAGHGVEWYAALHILHARLVSAVDRAGLRYTVEQRMVAVDGTRQEAMLVMRSRTRDPRAAELLWHEVRRFASEGVTTHELAAEVQATATAYRESAVLDAALERAGDAMLFGVPYRRPADDLSAMATLRPPMVAQCAAHWLRTALMVVPRNLAPKLPGMVEDRCPRRRVVPAGRALRRRLPARLLRSRARNERLVLGPDGLSMVDGDGDVHTVRFSDVLVVEENGPARVVFSRYGCVVDADPRRFRGARLAVRAIDAAVPARRRLGG
jgi:hypothetical protein